MPIDQEELCAVATDDICLVHRHAARGRRTLERLDSELEAGGMPKNPAKDVSLEGEMLALGCKLTANPPAVEPAPNKLVPVFASWLDLVANPHASPVGLNRSLGVEQWFSLLTRAMFGIFGDVYDFVRRTPDEVLQALPTRVHCEVAVAVALMPLLGADLSRTFLPYIIASDAAHEYGFGVVVRRSSNEQVRKLARLSERHADYVRLHPSPLDPPLKDRLGHPHQLDLCQGDG